MIGLPLSKGMTSIGTLAIIISSLGYWGWVKKPASIKGFLPILVLGSIYFFYLLSITYSKNVKEAFDQIIHQHAFVTFPFVFWVLSDWLKSNIHRLCSLFVNACLLGSIITLILFVIPESQTKSITNFLSFLQTYPNHIDPLKFGLYSPFIDRLHFSYLIGFAILYEIYGSIKSHQLLRRIFKVSILLITMILLGARGAQISFLLAISVGTFLFFLEKIKRQELSNIDLQQKVSVLISITLVFVIMLPLLAYNTIPAIQKRYDQMIWELDHISSGEYLNMDYENFTTLTRIRAIQNAWEIVKKNPLLGVGIGDFNSNMEAINSTYADRVPVHNQNFFLYLWASCGIGALITFLCAITYFVIDLWRQADSLIRIFGVSYVLFILSCSMLDVIWIFQIGNVSLALFLSSIFILGQNSVRTRHLINEDTSSLF